MNNHKKVLIASILLALSIGLFSPANAVVVVAESDSTVVKSVVVTSTTSVGATITEINSATYASILANPKSWVARFQAGATSGTIDNGNYEMSVWADGMPKPDYGQHNWVYPQTVGLYFGYGANIVTMYAGTISFGGVSAPLFNAFLMKVTDSGTGFLGSGHPFPGSVSFNDGTFVTGNQMTGIPNILVDETTKYFLFDLGKMSPQFKIEGMFNARNTSIDKGHIEFTGVYIPEPSVTLFLSAFLLLFPVFRRR